PDVLQRDAQVHQQVQASQRRRAGPGRNQLDLVDFLPDHGQAIDDGGGNRDGGAMLVIVKNRDVHAGAGLALNLKALGRLDVFQVDPAESGLKRGDDVHQFVRIGFIDFNVKDINAGELFEQDRLAFHHG